MVYTTWHDLIFTATLTLALYSSHSGILAVPDKRHGPTLEPLLLESMALSFNSLKHFLKYYFLFPDLPILFFQSPLLSKSNSANFSFSISLLSFSCHFSLLFIPPTRM